MIKNLQLKQFRVRLGVSLLVALVGGAVLAGSSPGGFWGGWLAAAVLLWAVGLALLSAWQWLGGGKTLGWMMLLAFGLRLVFGAAMTLALPAHGYDNPQQNAGYLFYDAFKRDGEAWKLANSHQPLAASFREEFTTDQYGGLLSLSAGVYRYLSPDAHRPLLVVALAAFAPALGVAFLYAAVSRRWNLRLAKWAGWIFVLYPDAIFFSSSQLREPFLIGMAAIGFWAVLSWQENRRASLIAFFSSLAAGMLLSSRVTPVVFGMLLVVFWAEYLVPRSRAWHIAGWVGMLLAVVAFGLETWHWFETSAWWDLQVTEDASGWVATLIDGMDLKVQYIFITFYGLAQPVLPAAIADPSIPLWRTIVILRSLGWYLLIPLLVYAFLAVWFVKPPRERRILAWLAVFSLFWLVVAAARAGGDMTDNPRYRVQFIPFLALLAGWALLWAWQRRDLWLVRILAAEAVFLGFFGNWYFSRYFQWGGRLPFWDNVKWIIGLSALILGSGLVWEGVKWLRKRRQAGG
jgi:peptidoglycan/LPS O-acetylase OafA/YrhL